MRAGYAEVELTPEPGEEMTGYGLFRNRRAVGTMDPLLARALALDDGASRAVVVQADLLGLSKESAAAVRTEVERRCGLPPERIMLHCTHTHSGPASMHLIGCGTPSEYFIEAMRAKLVAVIEGAMADLHSVTAAYRFSGDFDGGFAHNRTGASDIDTAVRGVRIEVAGASPILVLSYACHPVTLGVNREYSADYPGCVIQEFNAYGQRAMFLNGCCGDINPLSNACRWGAGTRDTLRIYGRDLAAAARRAMQTMAPWTPGPLRASSRMVPLDMQMPGPADLQRALAEHRTARREHPEDNWRRVDVVWHEKMLRLAESGSMQDAMQAEIQVIACGDLVFVGLSAETFTRLGRVIRESAFKHHLLIAGTCNGVLGYLGTPEDVAKQGYASNHACKIYLMPLPAPGAGLKWAEEGGRLVRETVG